jgi:hypothetical protein
MPEREPITLEKQGACPGVFYAFGASYPDGNCHDGHLDDSDSDYCYLDFDYRPCPFCRNSEYLEDLADYGHFMPPFGYGEVVSGDYFALITDGTWVPES